MKKVVSLNQRLVQMAQNGVINHNKPFLPVIPCSKYLCKILGERMNIPQELHNIMTTISACGGKPFVVGGYVRDQIMGVDSKDIDVEVFGLTAEDLGKCLAQFGKVDAVGVSFEVIKLTTENESYDFSLPRVDSKVGDGHKGIKVLVNHTIGPKEAASRRDFTINAISWSQDGLYDPFNAVAHINNKTLQATSEAFSEDPLRVLRGFQFCGRFGLMPTQETLDMCNDISGEFAHLSKERVWGEWEKWARQSISPQNALLFLQKCGWLVHFPEVFNLIGVPQEFEYHPEGDVFNHTVLVCDEAARIAERESLCKEDRIILLFAALCHDFGKVTTTEFVDGRIRARGHDKAGVPLAESFLRSINAPNWVVDHVCPLVSEHMAHCGLNKASRKIVQRLSYRLGPSSIRMLSYLIEADMGGRPPKPKGLPKIVEEIVGQSIECGVFNSKPERLVQGRDIAHLVEQGPLMGKLVNKLYEMQLNDKFRTKEHGIRLAHSVIGNIRS